ncbi:LPXTG cell wall anchor domain-containing protein [Arthrobacter sp. Bz4]|uniref:LPXTG cell wall anchor domain-containing protein n=1 Tax=Arthrobacter sp. Bz4 TaxID=2171979 RepID=UPI000D51E3D3|nr:LPXTG cell wall anchor domain-containing protein [Arthrobacter sp. Bz4]PVE14968.1 peptidase [Arthrobacter sp. Bz4]
MKKTTSVLAIAGLLTFAGAGAAQAIGPITVPAYVSNPAETTVSSGTVAPGEAVVFSYTGGEFTPGEIVDITATLSGTPSASSAGAGGFSASRGGPLVLSRVINAGTATVDANGNFSSSVVLPEDEGVYTLTATGRESGFTAVSTVVVDAQYAVGGGTTPGGTTGGTVSGGTTGGTTTGTAAAEGGLANTGIDSAMLLWGAAGIGALGLGAGSIFVARRRAGAEA